MLMRLFHGYSFEHVDKGALKNNLTLDVTILDSYYQGIPV